MPEENHRQEGEGFKICHPTSQTVTCSADIFSSLFRRGNLSFNLLAPFLHIFASGNCKNISEQFSTLITIQLIPGTLQKKL